MGHSLNHACEVFGEPVVNEGNEVLVGGPDTRHLGGFRWLSVPEVSDVLRDQRVYRAGDCGCEVDQVIDVGSRPGADGRSVLLPADSAVGERGRDVANEHVDVRRW